MKMIFAVVSVMASVAQAKALTPKVICSSTTTPVGIEFEVPKKIGQVPQLGFDYPVVVTEFSFRDGNLLLIAQDKDDSARVRVFVSAQLDTKTKTYLGQMMTDEGGHQIMIDNGPVQCEVR